MPDRQTNATDRSARVPRSWGAVLLLGALVLASCGGAGGEGASTTAPESTVTNTAAEPTTTTTSAPTTAPTTASPTTAALDPCDPAAIHAQLAESGAFVGARVEIVDGLCVDGWALVDSDPGELGDTWLLAQLVDGRWQSFTGFPSRLCRDEAAAQGVPQPILDRDPFGPCQGAPTGGPTCDLERFAAAVAPPACEGEWGVLAWSGASAYGWTVFRFENGDWVTKADLSPADGGRLIDAIIGAGAPGDVAARLCAVVSGDPAAYC